MNASTDAYISRYRVARRESAGSSLKFCVVAAGAADFYPALAGRWSGTLRRDMPSFWGPAEMSREPTTGRD